MPYVPRQDIITRVMRDWKSKILILTVLLGIVPSAWARKEGNWAELSPTARWAIARFLAPDPNRHLATEFDHDFFDWYRSTFCGPSKTGLHCAQSAAEAYPEYRYDHLSLNMRVAAACVVQKVVSDFGSPEKVPPEIGPIVLGDRQGFMEFSLKGDVTNLISSLKDKLYTDDFMAARGEKTWGLRSPKSGQELHWYQDYRLEKQKRIHVHIDYVNPGKWSGNLLAGIGNGIEHAYFDLWGWDDRRLSQMLFSQPDGCGIGKSDLAKIAMQSVSVGEYRQIMRIYKDRGNRSN